MKDKDLGPIRASRLVGAFAFFTAVGILIASLPVTADDGAASFSGTGSVFVVGKTSEGRVVRVSIPDVAYQVTITSSSLALVTLGMTMGGPLVSGAISISTSLAHGGGTLGGSTPSQMAFTASSGGGEFQCLMAGFTAGFPFEMDGMTLTIIQMDVHGAVTPGSYSLTGE